MIELEMASVYGFHLTGSLRPCNACGIAKASQTRISKSTKIKATMPGERLFMDTTGPFSECLPTTNICMVQLTILVAKCPDNFQVQKQK